LFPTFHPSGLPHRSPRTYPLNHHSKMFATALLAVAAMAGVVSAQTSTSSLVILSPGGPDLWWVADSTNTLSWSCHDNTEFQNFTVLIGNSNVDIFPEPQAIVAIEDNFDCSETISGQQANLTPSSGYFIQLANPLNNTDVYATSQPFEVQNLGSAYPATSATPIESGFAPSSTSGSTGAASPTGSGSADTTTSGALSLGSQSGLAVISSFIAALYVAFAL